MVWLAWRGQRAKPGKTLIIIVLRATGLCVRPRHIPVCTSLCVPTRHIPVCTSLRASTIGYRLALFERLDCVTKSPVCGYEKK